MLRINELKLPIEHSTQELTKKISKLLKYDGEYDYSIVKRSLDCRKKPDLFYSYCIDVNVRNEDKILKRSDRKVTKIIPVKYKFPYRINDIKNENRPIIIGMGPAGLFAGLYLALNGFKPVIYERGKNVDLRQADIDEFFKTGKLNPDSNIQFGEGGAGTFSDGKLNTLIKEKSGRNRQVLNDLVKFGAPNEILFDAKPHIGTDILSTVIKNIRNKIIDLGGEVHFESLITDFTIVNNELTKITINNADEVEVSNVILAIGHSARDTFIRLKEKGLSMIPKPFAVGLRVSHDAKIINNYVYGKNLIPKIGNYSYKLTHTLEDGRGIYSFCMCPGGYVVNASSEEGHLAVNGMSYSLRDSECSNSAIIITLNPEDYMNSDANPLSGMYFQRELEKKAYELADGKIPVETYYEFKNRRVSEGIEVNACAKGLYKKAPVHTIMPDSFNRDFDEGMKAFGKIIPHFDDDDAVVYGVETRTSSPIKMLRNDEGLSNIDNLYVCGEGAGYAGGIMSAAVDGIFIAERVASNIING